MNTVPRSIDYRKIENVNANLMIDKAQLAFLIKYRTVVFQFRGSTAYENYETADNNLCMLMNLPLIFQEAHLLMDKVSKLNSPI